MNNFIPDQLIWWVSAVDVPMITAFIFSINRIRNAIEELRERFTAYKLEVAQNYASINHVKDLEARLISHLLRIETKLDNTAYRTRQGETS